jgi:hypothetical protein
MPLEIKRRAAPSVYAHRPEDMSVEGSGLGIFDGRRS